MTPSSFVDNESDKSLLTRQIKRSWKLSQKMNKSATNALNTANRRRLKRWRQQFQVVKMNGSDHYVPENEIRCHPASANLHFGTQ
ncbi:unnamed protein product [Peronospora belbahrii]|uniref:Uncharacterized protein n=1 Tax=Peronospora belbahrii TaxID=622444 RepID=A0ABN8CPU0_9STRA|nr:unnamed protein product [Peronospora belbahrii]